jgi:4-hydroxy-tetrahydrodipicolinate reductase
MGAAIIRLIADSADCQLCGAATERGHRELGADAGLAVTGKSLDVRLTDDAAVAVADCDVAIDFTAAAATDAHVSACLAHGCGLVLGTTGLDTAQMQRLKAAGQRIAIVYGRNMSIGVLVFTELARQAARLLGPDADIEIVETHHRHKADAPSGTALQLGEAVAAALGGRLEDLATYDRSAGRGPRRLGSIGFASLRAGGVVGDHDIHFGLAEEVLTLRHRALDRATFARGALRAARWVAGRAPGLYSMHDVLGLAAPGR